MVSLGFYPISRENMVSSSDIPLAPQIVERRHFLVFCEVVGIHPPLLSLARTILLVVVEEHASIFLKIARNYDANTRIAVYG